ncbi:MAG: hypothetical protein HZC41_01745 [Chloroflexi bacterium]|nr:hypothetical protein [Chloroflexota bacterium]
MKRLLLLIIGLLVIGLAAPLPSAAQDACPDLSFYNDSYNPGVSKGGIFRFEAGTRIIVSAALGSATTARFSSGMHPRSPHIFTTTSAVPGQHVYDIPQTTSLYLNIGNDLDSDGTIAISVGCTVIRAANSSQAAAPLPANLLDGRINNTVLDVAAPIAIYNTGIYAVDPQTGEGRLAVQLPDDSESDQTADENVLLVEGTNPFTGLPIRIYRLTTGEIQLNTFYADGKPYVVVWQHDSPETLYHLAG